MKIVVQEDGDVVGVVTKRILVSQEGFPGAPARVAFSIGINGLYPARNPLLPAPIVMVGNGILTATSSRARSFIPCTAPITWSVTKDGTFASETAATDLEIAAALYATIAFPAGPGPAVWDFPAGGAFSDGDVLRIWQSGAGPDATQNYTSLTFAGD